MASPGEKPADAMADHKAQGGEKSDAMAREMGHGAGMGMQVMVRDIRNRFWIALAFSLPIFLFSPMGMDFIQIPPPFGLRPPNLPNSRMQNRFEHLARFRIAENSLRHQAPAQPALAIDHVRPEPLADFGQRRLSGFDHLTSNQIGIQHRNVMSRQHVRHGGFAGADATCDSVKQHDVRVRCLILTKDI